MFDGVMTPALAPFSIAIGVMLLIAITEAAGTLFGVSPSGLIDQMIPDADMDVGLEADADGDLPDGAEPSTLSALLGWLCVGIGFQAHVHIGVGNHLVDESRR